MFKKKRINIGALIRKNVSQYSAFNKNPKKKPDGWIECPDFDIKKPKKITKEEEEKDRAYSVTIYNNNYGGLRERLDYMIAIGKKEIVVDRIRIWLHATRFFTSRAGGLYSCVLTYIFRIKAIPEEIEENL